MKKIEGYGRTNRKSLEYFSFLILETLLIHLFLKLFIYLFILDLFTFLLILSTINIEYSYLFYYLSNLSILFQVPDSCISSIFFSVGPFFFARIYFPHKRINYRTKVYSKKLEKRNQS